MKVTEKQVEVAFAAYLRADGWEVSTKNRDYVDLLAKRGSELIVAELKGHTSSPGLDVDTGYGQLLRRIDPDEMGVRYALVVPAKLRWHATRVHRDVRTRLGVELFVVEDDGVVSLVSD
jgi:hypothetical protein